LALHLQNFAGTQKWVSFTRQGVGTPSLSPFFLDKRDFRPHTAFGETDKHFASQGWIRGPLIFSRKSQSATGNGGTNLLIRLRALFGVTARCEILAYLLERPGSHPHEVARRTHYFAKTVQDALVQMKRSGLVTVRGEAGRKIYALDPLAWKPLLRPDGEFPRYLDWPVIFSCLASLWKILNQLGEKDSGLLYTAAHLKQWARKSRPLLDGAGMTGTLRSEENYPGESYLPVFLEDVERWVLLRPRSLARPTRIKSMATSISYISWFLLGSAGRFPGANRSWQACSGSNLFPLEPPSGSGQT